MYTEKYKIMCHDTDPCDVARPSVVLRYMQETANHQMRDQKPSYMELLSQGKAFIISRVSVEIYRKLHQYEEITVKSWPCAARGVTFPRCYEISRSGELIARAIGTWALVNIADKTLCKASETDFSGYEYGELFELSEKRFSLPGDGFEKVGEYSVPYCQLDCNRHVNNTNYPDILTSYIPDVENVFVSSFSIRYVSEAKFGDLLDIYRLQLDDGASRTVYFKTVCGGRTNIEAKFTVIPAEQA